jgi:uncharacterized membrane protein YcaP (DUF421 family)
MKLGTRKFTITRPIIIDGKIDMSLLKEIGQDLVWLHTKIATTHTNIRDVTLATVTGNENVRVYSESKMKRKR